MTAVDNITDQADQLTQVVLPDGSILQLELFYEAATQRWTMDVTHPLLTVQGINIDNFPNVLRPWRNVVPFGLACQTVTSEDPTNIEDFVNGNAVLYTLTEADVLAVEQNVFGGVLQ
jgi:hypothetical protein